MKINKKLLGGSLQYTVLIVLVMTLLVFFYVLFSLNLSHLNILYTSDAKWVNVLYSAEKILGCGKYSGSGNYEIEVLGEKVKIELSSWGGYTIAHLSSPENVGRVGRTLLLGKAVPNDTLALYTPDNKGYLSVGGKTRIYGNCYVPAKGVKRTMGVNHVFAAETSVFGEIKKSDNLLPELLPDALSDFRKPKGTNSETIFYGDIENRKLINSFQHKTIMLNMGRNVRLGKVTVKGNVVILADSLVVSKNTILEDVCVYAKHIHIEDGWRGNGFFFAEQTLYVGKNASLLMPSILVVTAQNDYAELSIRERAVVAGAAVCYSFSKNSSTLTLKDFAQFHGALYSTSNMEIRGNVKGRVIAQQFISRGPSTKINHIDNAIIDAKQVNQYLVLPNLFDGSAVVIKRLY